MKCFPERTVLVDGPSDVTVVRGRSQLEVTCLVTSDPDVQVVLMWYHDDNAINTTASVNYDVYDNGSLVVYDVGRDDGGVYTCQVTSEAGDHTATATLTVQGTEHIMLSYTALLINSSSIYSVVSYKHQLRTRDISSIIIIIIIIYIFCFYLYFVNLSMECNIIIQ